MGMKPTWRPAALAVARELAVHAPVGLLDVLEHDVDLVGGGLPDVHHGVGDGGHDLALLLVGAAGVPLDGDVGHGGLLLARSDGIWVPAGRPAAAGRRGNQSGTRATYPFRQVCNRP